MKKIIVFSMIGIFPGITAQGQEVSSLQIIPGNATASDNIRAVVSLTFPNSPCSYVSQQITPAQPQPGDTIIINAYYCHETGSGNCELTDTFTIGQLSGGNYVARFLLSSRPSAGSCGAFQLYDIEFQAFSVSGSTNIGEMKAYVASSYPNPAAQTHFVNFFNPVQSNVEIKIYNLSGSTVKKWDAQGLSGMNQFSLDVHDLPEGAYLYELTTSSGNTFGKFAVGR